MPGMSHASWDALVLRIGEVLEELVEDAIEAAHEQELEAATKKGVQPMLCDPSETGS